MKLAKIFAVLAASLMLPLSAQAASVSVLETNVDEGGDGYMVGENVIDVFAGATFFGRFFDDDSGITESFASGAGQIDFRLWNNSAFDANVVILSGNIDQSPGFGFFSGVDVWFDGVQNSYGIVSNIDLDRSFFLGAGESVVLSFSWDDITNTNALAPAIDFAIGVNAVPVPAAGFLLLGGIGGLMLVRRRKS